MNHPRKLFAVFLLLVSAAAAQNSDQPAALALSNKDNGRRVSAKAGQRIEITLGSIGPGEYGDPQLSSPTVRVESVAYAKEQNPGGPTKIYTFRAVSNGEAQIKIVHTETKAVFTVTIVVVGGERRSAWGFLR